MFRFKLGEPLRMMFATIAFGLGIDIQDIRHVIQVFRTADLAEYWQCGNRGGRDGDPATVVTCK